ncbi:hypothetical protein ACLB2K_038081 [Fragaria x ananassa]
MILLNDYDDFTDIMAVPLDFFCIWVEVYDLPVALTTDATLRLVGETIRPILNVNQATSALFCTPYHLNKVLPPKLEDKNDLLE